MRDIFNKRLSIAWFQIGLGLWARWIMIHQQFTHTFFWNSNIEWDCICWALNELYEDLVVKEIDLVTWASTTKTFEDLHPNQISIKQANILRLTFDKKNWPFKAILSFHSFIDENNPPEENWLISHQWFVFLNNKIRSIPKNFSDNPEFCTVFNYNPWSKNNQRIRVKSDFSEVLVMSRKKSSIETISYRLLPERFIGTITWCKKYVYYISNTSSFDTPEDTQQSISSMLDGLFWSDKEILYWV